jgi:hypothetical protein
VGRAIFLRDESLNDTTIFLSRRSRLGNREELEAALEQFREIAMDLVTKET